MAGQVALVGWALGQTIHYASDLELWLQQAMKLVGLRMMTSSARRAAKDAVSKVYADDARHHGDPIQPTPADWAETPTRAVGGDRAEEAAE